METLYICTVCGRMQTYEKECEYCQGSLIPTDYIRYTNYDKEAACERYVKHLDSFNQQKHDERVKEDKAWREGKIEHPYWMTERRRQEDLKMQAMARAAHQPRCPICGSTCVHKISTVNKAGAVAVFGIFAIGHVSKTYKCDNCGAKF